MVFNDDLSFAEEVEARVHVDVRRVPRVRSVARLNKVRRPERTYDYSSCRSGAAASRRVLSAAWRQAGGGRFLPAR